MGQWGSGGTGKRQLHSAYQMLMLTRQAHSPQHAGKFTAAGPFNASPSSHQAIRCSKYAVTIIATKPRHCRPVFSDTASAAQKEKGRNTYQVIPVDKRKTIHGMLTIASQAPEMQPHRYVYPAATAVPTC